MKENVWYHDKNQFCHGLKVNLILWDRCLPLSSKYLCDCAAPLGAEYCWNIQTLERCDTQFVKKLSTRFHLKPNSIQKSKIWNTPGNLGQQNFSDTNVFSKCTFLRIMIICGKSFFDCQTDLLKLKTCNLEKMMWARVSKDSNLKGRSNYLFLKNVE